MPTLAQNITMALVMWGIVGFIVVTACTSGGAKTPASVAPPATAIPMATQAPPPTRGPEPTITLTPQPTLRPPRPLPRIQSALIDPIWLVPPSIDQQILDSDTIVVASFVSATAGVQTIPGDLGVAPTYRPTLKMTFRPTEYLKGSGPTQFTVEMLDYSEGVYINGSLYEGYLTEAAAMTEATNILAQRDTSYDNRPGVLFLKDSLVSAPTSGEGASGTGDSDSSTAIYRFLVAHPAVQNSFDYGIDTLARTWLPAKEAPSDGASGSSGNSEYVTDGSETPPPVTSLASLKTRITEIDTMLAAGDGTEAYADCIYDKLTRERYYRDWTPITIDSTIESGSPAGTELRRSPEGVDAEYNGFWASGTDANYFENRIVDDDTIASNGYSYSYAINRPLSDGSYTVNFHMQHYTKMVCSFKPADGYVTYNVTVTAPAGTLHEAFFDPVTIGTAVGADATNGVLKPASFTVGETATRITGLKWENNQAVLTLSPHVSLANYALDIIELDGSVSLSLEAKDATVDATAATHTWSVTDQPWHEGDKLMLRMREEPNEPPAFASDTYNFTVAENASSFTIIGTALATDPNEGDEVLHTIESGNEGGKFNIDGWAGFILVRGALDYETRSSYTLTVKADDGKGGTDTATVNITVTDVAE